MASLLSPEQSPVAHTAPDLFETPLYLALKRRGAAPVTSSTYLLVQRDAELRLTKTSIREVATDDVIETTYQVDDGPPYTYRDGQSVLEKITTVEQLRRDLLSHPNIARILAERALEMGAMAS